MKHLFIMMIMVVIAGAVIATGLYQRAQEQRALEYAQQQADNNQNNSTPANINSANNSTDPFGLFGPEQMIYEVTLTTQWSSDSHGQYHVSTGHFSAPIVWVGKSNPVFSLQTEASPGLEEVAETGRTQTIKQELEALEQIGELLSFDIYDRVETPDEFTFQVTVNRGNPVVSLVSMIAPSPDWFVALEGRTMLEEGRWKKQEQIQLVALDAGTEDGTEFRLGNEATQPQGVIAQLTDIPSRELPPFATVTFTQVGYSPEED